MMKTLTNMKKTRLRRRLAGLISLLVLSQAPLPALHAAGATTSQEIDRETLVMERKVNGETRWSVEFE